MNLKENTNLVFQQISNAVQEAGRENDSVSVIAVTKYVDVDTASDLVLQGVQHIGENRVDKFLDKYHALSDKNLTWHLIGTLQRRKVKEVISYVDYFHALDRESLAKEIEKRAEDKVNCFVQVNVSGEESKHGLTSHETIEFIKGLGKYSKINVIGLMTMAPFVEDEDVLRNCFKKLRQLRDEVKELKLDYAPCEYLSMGMSNDYKIAIEEGATHVRIGTSLVGNELK